ncbi:hypothetical protein [Eikenella corrodens]|uniref:hypothetical protein n=1 Tax=Eikenella corrodens TaxID=539 RepID=UPI0028EA85CD|nr:hypothetical protein [Eikenella corrodens]
MRPLITALILLAACTDSNPNIHEPPAMTASPSQAPDQTEQPNGKTLLRQAQQQYDGYYKYQAAYLAYQAAQAGETLPPHLAELAKNYQPDAPTATPQYFDLSPQDLATVTAQAEQGSRKAAKRLTEYYQFSAYGLPDLPEDEREAKAEYWQKRAQEIQAK